MALNQQSYDHIVQQAWQSCQQQGQSNSAEASSRQQEAGHSTGSQSPQAQKFASSLLRELSQAGCSNISEAMQFANKTTQSGASPS